MKKFNSKKFTKLVALTLAGALGLGSLFGCGKKKEETTTEDTVVCSEGELDEMNNPSDIEVRYKEGMYINELTGDWIDESFKNQRPVCIMINNIIDAMPQYDISKADVTFEILVEGGITRFMCVFKDYSSLTAVGSIRSARHDCVILSDMIDGFFMHCGWSVLAEQYINEHGTKNLNLGGNLGNCFYRESTRKAPHNVFTTGELINKGIDADGYNRSYEKNNAPILKFYADETDLGSGMTANKMVTAFNDGRKPWFEYDAATKRYKRFQYGKEQVDGGTGEQLTYKNVIVMFTSYHTELDILQSVDWNLGGDGYYFTNGEYVPITWNSSTGILQFYDESGSQLKLNPGNTFISMNPTNYKQGVTIE